MLLMLLCTVVLLLPMWLLSWLLLCLFLLFLL